MMPEEWPIAASAADQNAPARHAGSDRLATVRADFFLDAGQRLTEQERALMTAMLHCLVGDVADSLRAALPSGRTAANDDSNLALIEALTSSRLLDEPELVAMLLRRADEERIAIAAMANVLGQRDRARSIDSLTAALVQLLDENDGLTDDLILAAAHEGEIAFLGQVLARRAGVPAESAIEELLSAKPRRMMALFR